ncbi:MAG: HAD-IIB family hydrolase [Candidatus Thiodiazotropha weberae]|nr:HAD-IIB family hydrolase [Candidatus Thiodiazotropha lotti]MCG8014155.1 HAD-IIB family hydrolase [Candidatus Thiodiazotropha lotti]MCG8021837.1 HAD-IIB family hydrolase [Candidatus Thiodiazotropha lotti]MCW4209009.1 HAD-IIB family hydrolase [Candidatus Thiodiazotropha lotti]MCW4213637.1 HAD-IIB family hydrolase [Candidatus Thiodiazotropha lotti]
MSIIPISGHKRAQSPIDGWLVFTDLDGTLLDHHSYDFSPALPALRLLKENRIPVIPVSSKTHAELNVHKAQLELDGPMVAENGSVIIYPNEESQIAPPGYLMMRDFLVECRTDPDFDFIGFGDMSDQQVMDKTGLDRDSAHLARQRLATEPLLWRGDRESLKRFQRKAESAGMKLLQGGRFLHLLSDTDKGQAVTHIVNHLRSRGQQINRTIALGDSDNDRAMLLAADTPIIVRKHDGSHMTLPERPDTKVTEEPGPAGWNQALLDLIQQFEER